ncbi:MAG: hypothetical protein SFY69_08885 [Planctomycetota bacterium]|nr:hypothetical protein [Planctomycetota bacterium]
MRRTQWIIAAAGGTLVAPAALAQHALGDGTGLQRTGIREVRPLDIREEVRLRNAIVTGHATGGRSLQIAPPYSDVGEFRAALGSDSLFRFRRDSYSGGLGMGWRGSESIQYQYAFTTGNTRDQVGTVTRLGGGLDFGPPAPPGQRLRAPTYSSSPFDAEGSDSIAPQMGTLRSTAAFSSTRSLSPAVVGTRQVESRYERITASSLLGVRNDPLVADLTAGLLVDPETAAMNAQRPVANASAATTAPDRRQDLAVRTAYDDLVSRMEARLKPLGADAPADATPGAPAGSQPAGPQSPGGQTPGNQTPGGLTPGGLTPGGQTPGSPVPGLQAPGGPGAGSTGQPTAGVQGFREPAWVESLRSLRGRLKDRGLTQGTATRADERDLATERSARVTNVDRALLDAIRDMGGTVESYLLDAPNPGDLYADHVATGQRLIGQGQYFDAEEHFARALAMRPGDVVSMLGRLHAQIGAGLYLSAAVNLRVLFEERPELVGVRYAGETMPNPQRLRTVAAELVEALDKSRDNKGVPSPEAALLLAYVGFQIDDAGLMMRGLDTIERERAAEATLKGQAAPGTDALAELLRGVWVGGEAK